MAGKKNVVWVIDVLGRGGAENLMVPSLKYLNKDRFNPRVCVFREKYGNPIAKELMHLGIPVDFFDVDRLRDLSVIPRLLRYFRQHKVDLVHTQLEFANTFGNIVSKLDGVPSVCTLHTMETPTWGTKKYFHLKLMRWSLRMFCDKIITVAADARQHYLTHGKDSPEKVITIYNGIDLSRFKELSKEAHNRLRESLGIPQKAPLIITVAVLRPAKGIQYMLKAFPDILGTLPDAYYLVVGDGEYRNKLGQMANDLGMGERVKFAGFRQDVPYLLAISDLFVLPTLEEVLPTVLAESMAACRPIVVSAVGGVPEMVQDGVNGLLLPPREPKLLAEGCIRLLSNPKEAHKLGKAGWEIVNERFNILKQVKKLGNIYEELLTATR